MRLMEERGQERQENLFETESEGKTFATAKRLDGADTKLLKDVTSGISYP